MCASEKKAIGRVEVAEFQRRRRIVSCISALPSLFVGKLISESFVAFLRLLLGRTFVFGLRQCKKFENRLILGEVMGKSLVSCFFDSQCSINDYCNCLNNR